MTVKQLENLVRAGVVVRKQDERVELCLGTGLATGQAEGFPNPIGSHPLPNPAMSLYPSGPSTLPDATCEDDADRNGAGRSRLIGGAFGSHTRSASASFAGWQHVVRQQPVSTQRQARRAKGTMRESTRMRHRTGNTSVCG
jgi:hypothetical protein